MKTFVIIIFSLIYSLKAISATKTAVANTGNGWSVASNWSPSGVPQDGDTIIIPAGFTLTVKGNIYSSPNPNIFINIYGNLDFDPSGKLELGVNSVINIPLNGSITSNGTSSELIKINGVTMFNGQVDGTINGPAHSTSSYGPSPNGFMPGVLPVKLLSFSAIKNDRIIILKWTTLSETNSKRFDVERSNDGTDWSLISSVEAAGTSSTEKTYSAIDSYPGIGKHFYRLKTIDRNENYEYSKILLVSNEPGIATIKVYPNPASANVTVALNGVNPQDHSVLLLTSIDGKTQKQFPVTGSSSSITIDLVNLPKGLYHLVLTETPVNKYSQMLVIQ